MTTTESPQSAKSSTRRAIKRKLDDSILKKAREALGLPLENPAEDESEKQSDEPSLKWRKPRHNTEEGQLYIKNKEKRKLLDEEQNKASQSSFHKSTPKKNDDKKSKKKRKKKKRKTDGTGNEIKAETGKNPEGEKRHEMEGISYLQLWAANRDHWKFEKRKQTWLLKNCLNANLIDDKRFETLLEYIASVKGAAKQATQKEMQSIVTKKEACDAEELDKESASSISEVMYDRARQIIQMLVD